MLRTLIDNLPDFIFVKDRESHFLMLNQAMSRLVGASGPKRCWARPISIFSEGGGERLLRGRTEGHALRRSAAELS